jgi:hypothetical protein
MPVIDREPPPPRGVLEPDGIDMSLYLAGLRRWWWLPFAMALVSGVVALAITVERPTLYESRVLMRINSTGIDRTEAIAMLRSRTLAGQVVDELGLNKAPWNMTVDDLISTVELDDAPMAPMVIARVQLQDPDMTVRVAKLLSEKAVAFHRGLNAQKLSGVHEGLLQERDQARRRFEEAATRYIAFQRHAQIDLSRREALSTLDKRAEAVTVQIDLETERARLAKAEDELSKQSRYVDAPRNVGSENALLEAATRREPTVGLNSKPAEASGGIGTDPRRPPGSLGGEPTGRAPSAASPRDREPPPLDLSNPSLNPIYQVLAYEVATSRTRVAALERQLTELISRYRLGTNPSQQLGDLRQKETDLESLRIEYELARDVYLTAAKRYESARGELAGLNTAFQITDPASAPPVQVPAHTARNTAIASASGALFGGILIVLVLTMSSAVRWRVTH